MVIDMSEFLHSNGDYRTLLSYRLAQKISVVTEIFVERFLQRGSRTVDQMQQPAVALQAEYRGGECGRNYFERDGNKAHQCSAGIAL